MSVRCVTTSTPTNATGATIAAVRCHARLTACEARRTRSGIAACGSIVSIGCARTNNGAAIAIITMCWTMCPVNDSALIVSTGDDIDASSANTPPTQHHSRTDDAWPASQPRP